MEEKEYFTEATRLALLMVLAHQRYVDVTYRGSKKAAIYTLV